MILVNSQKEVLDTSKNNGSMYNISKLYQFLGIEKQVDPRVEKYFNHHQILDLFFKFAVEIPLHTYTKFYMHKNSNYVEFSTSIPHYEFLEYCKEYSDVFQCTFSGVHWTSPHVQKSGRIDMRDHQLITLTDDQKEIHDLHQILVDLSRYVNYRFQHSKLK